jgi:hypothetical protein
MKQIFESLDSLLCSRFVQGVMSLDMTIDVGDEFTC